MAEGNVRYLETQKLLDAANSLSSCIEEYNSIRHMIESNTQDLISSWDGEGSREFQKDYSSVYQQLSDLADIMYELYDSLVNSDAIYVQTDEEIGKSFEMEE